MKTKTKEQQATVANFKVCGSADAIRNELIKNSKTKQVTTYGGPRPGCSCC